MWVAINILTVIAFFSCTFWILRIKYQRDIAPSKKHPQGQLVAEMWQETGTRPKKLVPIKANGMEVSVKTEHTTPSRYFFNKDAVGTCLYPTQPLFPFKFLQVEAKLVSWVENCPVPINPKVTTHYSRTSTSLICPVCSHVLDRSNVSDYVKAIFNRKPTIESEPVGDQTGKANSAIDASTDAGTAVKESIISASSKKKTANKTIATDDSQIIPDRVVLHCPNCANESNMVLWLDNNSTVEEQNLDFENIMTAEGFAMLQDTDGLALGQSVNEEGGEELRLARENKLNKRYIYGLLIAAALGAIGAAVFAYQAFTKISEMGG